MQPWEVPSLLVAMGMAPSTPKTKVKLPVYSASQIETWGDCPRKWGWDKIDGLPRSTTAAAELGSRVHNQLERWLKGQGFDFHADHVAANLASGATLYLPAPKAIGLEVETSFTDPLETDHGLHSWTGRVDWRLVLDEVTIGDHKTTSNPVYAKTGESLLTDVQANVYARQALTEFHSLRSVKLQWTYIPTRGGDPFPVYATLTRDQVDARFGVIDQIAQEINSARANASSARDLPYNPDACNKYGGCPYQSRCNLSPAESLKALMSNTNPQEMTLLERLKAAQGAPPAQPQAAAPLAPSYPTPVANAAGDMSAFATRNAEGRIICDLRGRPLSPDTIAKQYVQDPHTRGWLPIVPLIAKVAQLLEADADSFAATQAPAQAAAPQPPPAWAPPGAAAPPAFQPPAQTGPINPPEWQPPTAAHAPPQAPAAAPAFTFQAPQAAAPPQAPAAETGKRKRATKAEMEARRAAAANGVSAAPAPQAQAPMPWQPPAANAAPAAPQAPSTDGDSDASPIAILAINVSIPRGFEDYDQIVLDDLMPDVHANIKRDLQVDDYSLLDFGKGTGALSLYVAQAVKVACEAAGQVPVILHVDSRTREGSIVLSRLVAMASSVIRGA